MKLIKEFLYSDPHIRNTPSLTNVSGEAKLEVNRISEQQYFYLKEFDSYPLIGTVIKMLKCIFLRKNT